MTAMVSRPNWLRWRRHPPPQSPIPHAAEETSQVANEVARVVDQLRRMNDLRESKLR